VKSSVNSNTVGAWTRSGSWGGSGGQDPPQAPATHAQIAPNTNRRGATKRPFSSSNIGRKFAPEGSIQ